jgi:hypothetical protein
MCHRVTCWAGCQKATTELTLQNLQSLSHLCYPTDTRQLTSPQGEADEVSEGGMTLQALGGVNSPCGWYRVRGQLPSTGGWEHTHTHWCHKSINRHPGHYLMPQFVVHLKTIQASCQWKAWHLFDLCLISVPGLSELLVSRHFHHDQEKAFPPSFPSMDWAVTFPCCSFFVLCVGTTPSLASCTRTHWKKEVWE